MESFNEFLSSPLGVVFAGLALFVLGWMFFGVKQWEAKWKEWAIDTANAASRAGLTHTPKIFNALAVGDLAGAFKEVKALRDIFHDPAQLKAEFQKVLATVIDNAKSNPQELAALQQMIADASKGAASTVIAGDAAAALALNPITAIAAPPTLAAALLPHLPALAASPALQQISATLHSAGLGDLLPAVIAGHTTAQSSAAPSPAASDPAPPQDPQATKPTTTPVTT